MRNKYIFSTILVTLLATAAANAQQGFGTANPDPSSVIDMVSAKRGVLVPRIALTATNAATPVTSPAEALWVYNTATAGTAPNNVTPGFYYWRVNRWVRITNIEDITKGTISSTDIDVVGGTNAAFNNVTLAIADNAITNDKMADNAIGNAELADNAVDTAELAGGAVTVAKLDATGATAGYVATANADGTVTYQAIDASDLNNAGNLIPTVGESSIVVTNGAGTTLKNTTLHVADLGITTAKLAADAVTNAKLADNAVQTENILDGTIATADIADKAVTIDKIQNGTANQVLLTNPAGNGVVWTDKSDFETLTTLTASPGAGKIDYVDEDGNNTKIDIYWKYLNSTNGLFVNNNTATGSYAIALGGGEISGVGHPNKASGSFSVVGGGLDNEAKEYGTVVSGGDSNKAEKAFSSVTGGSHNIATGISSVVSGGYGNEARSTYEWVGGSAGTLYTPIGGAGVMNGADRLFNVGNGIPANSTKSDAFTILKNAKTGIGFNNFETTTYSELLQVNGNARLATLPSQAGANTDKIVVVDSNGVLKTINAMSTQGSGDITGGTEITVSNGTDSAFKDVTLGIADDAVTSDKILDGTIALADMGTGSVNSTTIVDGSVTSTDILDGTIATADIANKAVTAAKMDATGATAGHVATANADGTVTYQAIDASDLDNAGNLAPTVGESSIVVTNGAGTTLKNTTLHVADLGITTAKLAADAVTNAKLADNAVQTENIAVGAVESSDIKDGDVATVDIAPDAVTNAKLADNAVQTENILDGTIATADIANKAVTAAKMDATGATAGYVATANADGTVTYQAIDASDLDNAGNLTTTVGESSIVVTNGAGTTLKNTTLHVADLGITTAKLAADAVTNAKLADNAVQTENILDGTIALADMGTGSVNSTTIVDGSVTSTDILDGTIATADIANKAVTAAKMDATGATAGHVATANADGTVTYQAIDASNLDNAGNLASTVGESSIVVTNGAGTTLKNTTLHVADNGITTVKLAADAVDNTKLADNAVQTENILNGTIALADMGTGSVNSTTIVDGSVTSTDILDGTIALADMGTGSVNSTTIVDGSVDTIDLKDDSVTAAKMNAGSVTVGSPIRVPLADNNGDITYGPVPAGSVAGANLTPTVGESSIVVTNGAGTTLKNTTLHVADNGITTAKLAADAVDNTKLADNAVQTENILNGTIALADMGTGSVNSTTIVDGSVTSADILDGTIATADIANKNVTAAKLDATGATPGYVATANADGTVTYQAIDASDLDNAGNLTPTVGESSIVVTNGAGTTLKNTTLHVADLGITTAKLAADAVTNAKLADNAVQTENIALGAVESSDIKDGDVATVDIAPDAITNAKLADNAVQTENILNGTIALADMGTGSVNSTTIVDGSVDTIDLKDDSVTAAKMNAGSVTVGSPIRVPLADNNGDITYGPVPAASVAGANLTPTVGESSIVVTNGAGTTLKNTTLHVADLGITTAKLAADAVTNAKLADNAVQTENIALGAVESSDIKDGDVATVDIAPDAITNAKLADNAVQTENILDGTIALADMGTGSVNSTTIVDGSVTSTDMTGGNTGVANRVPVASATGVITYQPLTAGMLTGTANLSAAADAIPSIQVASGGTNAVLVATTLRVADLGITTAKLAADAVTNAKLADNAVQTENILDGTIALADMGTGSVNSTTIVDGSVTSTDILDGTIATADIANKNVTAAKLDATGATPGYVATANADGTVTYQAIDASDLDNAGNLTPTVGESSIVVTNGAGTTLKNTTLHVADNGITTAKLAPDAVTSAKILDGEVNTADIANLAVTNGKLGADAVTNAKLADNAVQTENILDGTIALADMGTGSVNSTTIVDGSVTSTDMTGGNTGVANRVPVASATGVITYQPLTAGMLTGTANLSAAADAIPSIQVVSGGTNAVLIATTLRVADLGITTAKLAADAVDNTKLADNAVQTENILNGTIALADMGTGSVNSTTIVDGSVTSTDILDGTIALADMGTGAVNSTTIVDGSITSTDMTGGNTGVANRVPVASATGVVTYQPLTASMVTGTANLSAADAIPSIEVVSGGTNAVLVATTLRVPDSGITTAKLAPNAVTSAKILDGEVATADLANLAVTNGKLGADAVTTDKIAANAVETSDIKDANVTPAKLTPGTNNTVMTTAGGTAQWVDKTTFVSEPWRVQNTANAATTNAENIYQAGNVAIGFAAADAVSTSALDVKAGTVRVREIANAFTPAATDKVVLADANGVLRAANSAMPKFFYMPAVIFDTSAYSGATVGPLKRNLYNEYIAQFTGKQFVPDPTGTGGTVGAGASGTFIASAGSAPATQVMSFLPPASGLYYYITYYDTAVFSNVSIDANGIMTYSLIGNGTEASYMNIVFVVK